MAKMEKGRPSGGNEGVCRPSQVLGFMAPRWVFPCGNESLPLPPLQDKTRRSHHLFPIQTMR